MARRLVLDPRRVQQLAKEGKLRKNERGEYVCEHNIIVRQRELTENRTTKATGLTQKQQERLEIQILREKGLALTEHRIVTQDAAIIKELAPIMVAFKASIRELQSALVDVIALSHKSYYDERQNGKEIADHELKANIQSMLARPLNDRLTTMSKDLDAWKKRKG
jgi:hypothetical protein